MSSRGKVRLQQHENPTNYRGNTYPSIEETTFSDLQYVWQSVDALKVGLERTEKKLEKIGKEPWNALSDIRGLSTVSKKAQVPPNKSASLRGKKTVDSNSIVRERPTHFTSSSSTLLSSNQFAKQKTGSIRAGSSSSFEDNGDYDAESKEEVPIRYLNSPIPTSALVHYDDLPIRTAPPVDPPARVTDPPESLKNQPGAGRDRVHSPTSTALSAGSDVGVAMARDPSTKNGLDSILPVEHKVVIRVSRSVEDSVIPSLASRSRNVRKSYRPHTALGQQMYATNAATSGQRESEREVPPRECSSWPDIHGRDGLQKLREIVEKQQQDLASSVSPQPASASNVRSLHYSEEVVVPNEGGLSDDDVSGASYQEPNQRIMVRKVASAPRVSSYPGFSTSQPESARKSSSLEAVAEKRKKLDVGKDVKKKVTSGRRPKKSEWPPKVKKVAKITGDLQDYIICPSSWRKGQELIIRELGRFKPDLGKDDDKKNKTGDGMSDTDQPSATSITVNDAPSTNPDGSTEFLQKTRDSPYRVTRDVAEKDGILPEEDGATQIPKELEADSPNKSDTVPTRDIPNVLSNQNKDEDNIDVNTGVLESSLDESSQTADKSSEQSPMKFSAFKKVIPSTKLQTPFNKKRKPSSTDDAGKSQPKVRHYDADVVRNYISKQRKERMQRQQEEKLKKQRQMQEKQKKLLELQQLQKKLAQSKGTKAASVTATMVNGDKSIADPNELRFQKLPEEEAVHLDNVRHRRKSRSSKDEKNAQQPLAAGVIENSRLALIKSPVDRAANISEQGLSSTSSSLENERVSPKNNADAGPSMSTTTFASSVSSSLDERDTDMDKMSTESPTADILFPKKSSLGALAASCQKEMSMMMARLQPFLNVRGREMVTSGEFSDTKVRGDSNDAAAKMERIEMLRATAESLQQRITEETARITHSRYIRSNSAQNLPRKIFDVRETSHSDLSLHSDYHGMPSSGQGEAPESTPKTTFHLDHDTRVKRVVRSKNQFSVFEGKLPGVNSLVKHAQMVAESQRRNGAATKIQSWFRGLRVRQMLKWKLPSGYSLGSRLSAFKMPFSHHTSLSSEISGRLGGGGTTDKHRQVDVSTTKQEENLLRTEFCAGHQTLQPVSSLNDSQNNLIHALLPISNSSASKPDPYNFINTLHRKLRLRQGDGWIPLSPTKPSSPKPERPRKREVIRNPAVVRNDTVSPVYADDFESSMKSSLSKGPSRSIPVGAESQDEDMSASTIHSLTDLDSLPVKNFSRSLEEKTINALSHQSMNRDSSAKAVSLKTGTRTDPQHETHAHTAQQAAEADVARVSNDAREEILSEGTLSEGVASFDAESLVTHLSSRTSSPTLGKGATTKMAAGDKHSLHVSESSVTSSESQSVLSISATHSTPKFESSGHNLGPDVMFQGLQFSPSALRLRMSSELNYLDSLEESLRQITTVERVQALALARQETVSLAQALQNEQQKNALEAERAKQVSLRGTEEHQRAIAAAQKKHEEVLAAATQSINQVRQEAHSAIDSTAHKLLESQAEAAKATAEAARQLAEANIATLGYPKSMNAQNMTKLVTASAASAAAAAVSSALKKLRRRAARHKDSATYSAASSSGDSVSHLPESRSRSSRYRSSKPAESSRSEDKRTIPPPSHSDSDATIPEEISKLENVTYTSTPNKLTLKEQENSSPPSASTRSPASVPTTSRDTSPVGADEQTMSEGSLPEIIEEEFSQSSVSHLDYSEKFEETVTEEEAEQYYRKILPSESHRLQSLGKRRRPDGSFSDIKSQSSHDTVRSELGEEHSSHLFSSEDSFNKFTMQMVHQYMKEEELRAKHQMALLELRDKSLVEKTKAEMAWLELQKQQLRDKGQDDKMPPLRKRQRGLMLRLEQEQAEIRRLREAHLVASQERQILLQQQQQIARLRHSTRQILGKIQKATPGVPLPSLKSLPINLTSASKSVDSSPKPVGSRRHHLSSSEAGASDEEISITADGSVAEEATYGKSESEIFSDIQSESKQPEVDEETAQSKSKANLQVMKGLKKIQSNRRNLTTREKRLLQRRKENKKLDTEEQKIKALEEETLQLQQNEGEKTEGLKSHQEQQVQVNWDDVLLGDNTADASKKEDAIKEQITQDQTSSIKTQSVVTEDVASVIKTASEMQSIPEVSNVAMSQADNNTSEVEEELNSADHQSSEVGEVATEMNKSSPETPPESKSVGSGDYSSSFESPTQMVSRQQNLSESKSTASGPSSERQSAPVSLAIRLPLSPRIHTHKRRDSSGSEDSFTVSQSGAETASDLSDIEGRIHALKEELRRRKVEAERLRKEQKRRSKERLKAQEASLLKQIEAYDCFIRQTKAELERELEVELQPKVAVKPQIRQPKVAESRHLSHKLQSSVGSTVPGAGGDSSADELGSPQANTSQVSTRLAPREDPIGSPSEPLSASSSKKSSLGSIGETLGDTTSPPKEPVEDVIPEEKKVSSVSSADDIKGESDNDDSTSDSVRTVTEVGDIPSQKSRSVGRELPSNEAEIGKVSSVNDGRPNEVSVTQDNNLQPELSVKDLNEMGVGKEIISRQSTMSDVLEELSMQEDTKSEGFSPILSLKDIEQEVVSSKNQKVKSESEQELRTVQQGVNDEEELELVKFKKSLSERRQLLRQISSEDDTVAEEIEEEIAEEDNLHVDTSSFHESKSKLVSQEAIEMQDSEENTFPIKTKDSHGESLTNKGAKSAEQSIEGTKASANAADISNHLLKCLLEESVTAVIDIMKKREKKNEEPHLVKRTHDVEIVQDTPVKLSSFKPEECILSPAQESDVANQTFVVDAPEMPAQNLSTANKEALVVNRCLEALLSDSLQTMLSIYKQRDGVRERKDITSSWKSSAVGQRVANILNEVDKNLSPSKDTLLRPNILSLSSPTAYSDVFLSPDGSPSTPGSPAKEHDERMSFRPSSPVLGERADDIQTPLDVSGLPSGGEEGEGPIIQDLNPDQEWFEDDLGLGEGQVSEAGDEAGIYYQIYPYEEYVYIREIPNKPPPPYTPPNHSTGLDDVLTATEGSFPIRQNEKAVTEPVPSSVIPSADKELPELVEEAASVIQREIADGCCADEVKPPKQFLEIPKDDRDRQDMLVTSNGRSFRRFVFDLTKEMLSEAQTTAHEPPRPPWMRPKWLSRCRGTTLPRDPQACVSALQRRVTQLVAPAASSPVSAATAAAVRLGRKKRDRVDEILVQELREEELDWVTYDEDEVTVKMQLADSIFDCLLTETGHLVAGMQQQRKHRRLNKMQIGN